MVDGKSCTTNTVFHLLVTGGLLTCISSWLWYICEDCDVSMICIDTFSIYDVLQKNNGTAQSGDVHVRCSEPIQSNVFLLSADDTSRTSFYFSFYICFFMTENQNAIK